MKVHEALSAVMADVQAVGKDGRVDVERGPKYSFRGVDQVVNAVGPVLRKHGCSLRPTRIVDKQYVDFESKGGGTSHRCMVEVEYAFAGPEGDELTCCAVGEASDYGDKATPKAMSVAWRTVQIQLFCIPTDEPDPDEHVVERAPVQRVPKPVAHAKQDIVHAIERDYPGLTPDEVKHVASEVWEWGAIVGDEIGPAVLDDLLGRIPHAVNQMHADEASRPNQ